MDIQLILEQSNRFIDSVINIFSDAFKKTSIFFNSTKSKFSLIEWDPGMAFQIMFPIVVIIVGLIGVVYIIKISLK